MSVYRADYITINVSRDEMQALLSISARGEDFPDQETILSALSNAGVSQGIDKDLLLRIQEEHLPVHELRIAEGKPSTPAGADELIWRIDISDANKPSIRVDGKADFKRLRQYEPVKSGDEILSILPGAKGESGYTVTGKTLTPEEGEHPLRAPAGKNTHLSEDGLTLYASIDGVATLKRGQVVVDNVLHIHGDINFATGNINYQGTVMIDGDVRSGFRVEASETIYVHGSVEAAEIYSKNGSIIIKNGILGRHRARLLAGDDLHCGFMQDAEASVKNNVVIKHYAINSNITSGGKILVLENEGLIRGGKSVAEKGIELLEAGSERNILTEMVLTQSDVGEEQSTLWHAKIRLAEEFQTLDSLKKRLEFLELLQKRLGSISPEREQEVSVLQDKITSTEQQVEKIRQEAEDLEQNDSARDKEVAVRIHQHLHRKVTVQIGHKKYYSNTIKGGVAIYRKGDELLVESSSRAMGVGHG